MALLLPARLYYAGDTPFEGQIPEADTAHIEAPQVSPRPAAKWATVVVARREFSRLFQANKLGLLGQFKSPVC